MLSRFKEWFYEDYDKRIVDRDVSEWISFIAHLYLIICVIIGTIM